MTWWRAVRFVGVAMVSGLVALGGGAAEAAKWDKAIINALPDEAFASVEMRPDGTLVRHLPHHRADGKVDPRHLRNAMSRINQVKWVDPGNAERARRHLLDHYRQLGLPVPGEARAQAWSARPPRAAHGRARTKGNLPRGVRTVRIPKPVR